MTATEDEWMPKALYARPLQFRRGGVHNPRLPARSSGRWRGVSEHLQKRIAESRQFSLQTLSAAAGLAGPRLRSVLIPALPAIMRVLHLDQIEVLLPVG